MTATHQCLFFSFMSLSETTDSTAQTVFTPPRFMLRGSCVAGREDITICVLDANRNANAEAEKHAQRIPGILLASLLAP